MGKDIFDIRQEEATADFARADARRQRLEDQQFEVCGVTATTPMPRITEALRRADARQAARRQAK